MIADLAIDTAADRFEAALETAQDADQQLRRLLGSLALADHLEAAAWADVRRAHADRLAACQSVGEALLAWVRVGGEIVLEEPEDGAAAAETPDEVSAIEPSAPQLEVPRVDPAPVPIAPSARCESSESKTEDPIPPVEGLPDDDPTDEAPPPNPLPPELVARLQGRFASGAGFVDETPEVVQTSLPHAIASRLGAPRRLSTASAWRHEVDLLLGEAQEQRGWQRATAAARHELVCYLVARARYLQDEARVQSPPADSVAQLRQVFGALSGYQETRGLRFVNGLSRRQRPAAGTWWAEASVWWRKLAERAGIDPGPDTDHLLLAVQSALTAPIHPPAAVDCVERAIQGGLSSDDQALLALVEPHAHLFLQTGRLKTLRTVLKVRARTDRGDDPAQGAVAPDEPAVEVGHEVVAFTRGRRALLVGGDRTNAAVDQTLDALELAELRRESGKRVRRVESMAEQVKAGTVDLVLFIRGFISHKVTELLLPACKAGDVEVVWVDDGYGAAAIVRALEGVVERGGAA